MFKSNFRSQMRKDGEDNDEKREKGDKMPEKKT